MCMCVRVCLCMWFACVCVEYNYKDDDLATINLIGRRNIIIIYITRTTCNWTLQILHNNICNIHTI